MGYARNEWRIVALKLLKTDNFMAEEGVGFNI
jgi:hypothetical protein